MSIFLRLLEDKDKGAALEAAVRAVVGGEPDGRVFDAPPDSFEQIPGAPFAYWVSDTVRSLFAKHRRIDEEHLVASGTGTLDDFRFLRCWWEVFSKAKFFPYAKGGAYAPFYFDHHLSVEWANDGKVMKAWIVQRYGGGHWARNIRSTEHYFRPGLTWPRRTQSGLALRAMPTGCIFADKGPAAFVPHDDPQALLALLAITNSQAFRTLVELQMAFGSYEVGVIQRTPVPDLAEKDRESLAALARRAWSLKRKLDTADLTSHAFILPALLQREGATVAERMQAWSSRVSAAEANLAEIQAEIDERCFDLYGFEPEDRAAALGAESGDAEAEDAGDQDDESEAPSASVDPSRLAAELVDWLIGAAFGRFDVRLATGDRQPPPEPEPFDPLPACSPGMLTGEDGLPLDEAPPGYPIPFPADGILVDDPGLDDGFPAERDLLVRVQQVLALVWGAQAAEIERELCRLLAVRDLRTYLRRPAGFFADHLGRWSKSRRKAPIFWPLATASGAWTIWIYYPRLTADTLYKAVDRQVSPKISEVETRIAQLLGEQEKAEGREASRIANQLSTLSELLDELKTMRAELLRVAALPYRPNLDDGVQITAAPLWELFRFPRWRNELQKTWRALEAGDYDWAHLARSIWPERIRERCKKDRSIAIAHDLEVLYEG
jgi:hypothetical protein